MQVQECVRHSEYNHVISIELQTCIHPVYHFESNKSDHIWRRGDTLIYLGFLLYRNIGFAYLNIESNEKRSLHHLKTIGDIKEILKNTPSFHGYK